MAEYLGAALGIGDGSTSVAIGIRDDVLEAGDLMVMYARGAFEPWATPSGWTELGEAFQSANSGYQQWWYKEYEADTGSIILSADPAAKLMGFQLNFRLGGGESWSFDDFYGPNVASWDGSYNDGDLIEYFNNDGPETFTATEDDSFALGGATYFISGYAGTYGALDTSSWATDSTEYTTDGSVEFVDTTFSPILVYSEIAYGYNVSLLTTAPDFDIIAGAEGGEELLMSRVMLGVTAPAERPDVNPHYYERRKFSGTSLPYDVTSIHIISEE